IIGNFKWSGYTELIDQTDKTFERFPDYRGSRRFPFYICEYFTKGGLGQWDHKNWLKTVLDHISKIIPEICIADISFRSLNNYPKHQDPPGINYNWIHEGQGLYVDDELVDSEPGDLIAIKRHIPHEIRDLGAPYYRTVIHGGTIDEIWHHIQNVDPRKMYFVGDKYARWFQDGKIYSPDQEGPLSDDDLLT
ncbi:MAG: hypothetical protein KDD48_06625, partial [Bdellovibrionales bacterium]|nr:hypothetical protein [Bdellovibrionales bacterium]